MKPEFWQGKKILLTGHTGFKGSWLSLWLQSMGAHVAGYALAPLSKPNLFDVAGVAAGMQSHIGDIRDLAKLQAVVATFKPDIVFHLAAQALVRPSYENPVETYSTNVMGTVHVLEAIRQSDCVKAVVVVTSDKCYENKEWLWGYREIDAIGGYDPYSNSKACSELVVAAYHQSFFTQPARPIQLASARAGNVIGGGDWSEDRLIPDILTSFEQQLPVQIRNPHSIRPWQHVLEPLAGYLSLAEKLYGGEGDFSGGWNFGPHDHDARPVSWIVDAMIDKWESQVAWTCDVGEHPHEAHYLKLDCSKAKAELQWQPVLSLAEALDWIVAWHQMYQNAGDMHAFSLAQISRYMEKRINNCE